MTVVLYDVLRGMRKVDSLPCPFLRFTGNLVTILDILAPSQYYNSMSLWHRDYSVAPASQNFSQKADPCCPRLSDPGTHHSYLCLDCKQDHAYLKNIHFNSLFSNSHSLFPVSRLSINPKVGKTGSQVTVHSHCIFQL